MGRDLDGTLQLIVRKGDIHPVTGKKINGLIFLPAYLRGRQTRSFDQSTGDLIYLATFQMPRQAFSKSSFRRISWHQVQHGDNGASQEPRIPRLSTGFAAFGPRQGWRVPDLLREVGGSLSNTSLPGFRDDRQQPRPALLAGTLLPRSQFEIST